MFIKVPVVFTKSKSKPCLNSTCLTNYKVLLVDSPLVPRQFQDQCVYFTLKVKII